MYTCHVSFMRILHSYFSVLIYSAFWHFLSNHYNFIESIMIFQVTHSHRSLLAHLRVFHRVGVCHAGMFGRARLSKVARMEGDIDTSERDRSETTLEDNIALTGYC